MGSRKVEVEKYKRQDGTVVRPHSRIVETASQQIGDPIKKQGLLHGLDLLAEEPTGATSAPVVDSDGFVKVAGVKVPVVGSGAHGRPLDFRGMDLTGKDFSGLDLRGADFSEAILNDVDFTGADLRDAVFTEVRMSSLAQGKKCIGVVLTGALLEGSDWHKTIVDIHSDTPLDFSNMEISESNFEFNGATVVGLEKNQSIYQTKILGAVLAGQDLSGADFKNASFTKCDFTEADLSDTQFDFVHKNNFVGAKLNRTRFTAYSLSSSFKGCDLRETLFENRMLTECDFSDTNMQGVRLSRVGTIASCDFSNADLTDSVLNDIKFTFGSYSHTPSSFTGVKWGNCEMSRVTIGAIQKNVDVGVVELKPTVTYDSLSFEESAKKLDLSPTQFEFLVVSKMIEVRGNITKEVIGSDFDPDQHHIAPWEMERLSKVSFE